MWKFSFKDNKNKWQSFTDKGNTDANAALNENPREHIFYIEHDWQNGYSPKWKRTQYKVDVREKTQENQEPHGNFNKRAIKIEWSEDPWPDFDFDTWVLVGPPQPKERPSNAATTATTATTAPAATTATTGGGGGGGGGGGANTSMMTEASTAPTMSDTSAGPSTHDALPDPWANANNSQRKYWQNSDANWQGPGGWQTIDDKASNMAGAYGHWHGGQYGGPAKKDGVRVAASTDEQPATVAPSQGGAAATQESQAATPPPGLEGQASTHKSHENSPAKWGTWEEVQAKEQAMEQDAIAIVTETPPKEHDAPFTQKAMPASQAITDELIMKAPPPVKVPAQHPKRAPPVCPVPKSLPRGPEQMGSDDSNSSIGGNQQGSDGSTKAVPLLANAHEEKLAILSEQVAQLTAELDATKRAANAAFSGEPIPLSPGNY